MLIEMGALTTGGQGAGYRAGLLGRQRQPVAPACRRPWVRARSLTPEHSGPGIAARLAGSSFTLAHEAARCIGLIVASDARCIWSAIPRRRRSSALARPDRIASMTLYEPAAFHLLDELGADGAAGFVEIAAIARRVRDAVSLGEPAGAAAAFVDYWNGQGTWEKLSEHVRAALTRWAAKAPLEFAALYERADRPRRTMRRSIFRSLSCAANMRRCRRG